MECVIVASSKHPEHSLDNGFAGRVGDARDMVLTVGLEFSVQSLHLDNA